MFNMLLCALTIVAGVATQDAPQDLHEQAWELREADQYSESAKVMQQLIDAYPDDYVGYLDYWDMLVQTGGGEFLLEHVRSTLARFEKIPCDERPEGWYGPAMRGCHILGDTAREAKYVAEEMERFPHGISSQLVQLNAARDTEDPRESVSLLNKYIADYPENISWVKSAARDRFQLLVKHPDTFTVEEMIEAAERFDQAAVEYIPVYGNPTIRYHALIVISNALLDHDPKQSLVYANRGLEFVAEMAPQTDEFDETIGRNFIAVQVLAHVRLEQWKDACDLAAALIAERDDPDLDLVRWLPFGEPGLRAAYAEALGHVGDVKDAHRQWSYAIAIEPAMQERYGVWCEKHPLDEAQIELNVKAKAAFLDARREGRKQRLLSEMEDRPAPPFTLLDLDGVEVSIDEFRGKVVVIWVWANGCGPCKRELEQLKKCWMTYQDSPDVVCLAVSTVLDTSLVPALVEKWGIPFRVLLSNTGFAENYLGNGGIPQMYFIDGEGNIRFWRLGYSSTKHYQEYFDWLIEAAGE